MTKTSIQSVLENKKMNEEKITQGILNLQKKMEKARTRALEIHEAHFEDDFLSMNDDNNFDEIHWELALEYREHVANAVRFSDGIYLTMNSLGDKTELISSIRFGSIETVIYKVEVPTVDLSQYSLATNGCIQYLDELQDPIYIS